MATELEAGIVFVVAVLASLCSCAPPGYHYGSWNVTDPTAAFSLQPNDPCQRPEVRSLGAVSWLNSRVGQAGGPPRHVLAIESLSGSGYGNSLTCHAVLTFDDGTTQPGVLSITDPGGSAPLSVYWRADANTQPAAFTLATPTAAAQTTLNVAPPGSSDHTGWDRLVPPGFDKYLSDDGESPLIVGTAVVCPDRYMLANWVWTFVNSQNPGPSACFFLGNTSGVHLLGNIGPFFDILIQGREFWAWPVRDQQIPRAIALLQQH